ncbi:dihydroxyacetone kinase subunit DhaK [Salicibibacter halophilus]|uniref:Dihydroxyacetone kinase subunit DhaK n=1 Tax=Salicibibacter halophilus TaxID=2502791 RepID=A0A514LIX0_9BACI|nr:dihydroxyacetone kinase subunit DhaK [Salicibibacter halophilus]QDI91798.1 dihydroxyacetone kinase subunit DhaK [Salicibibacter halophilus]
MKKLMNDPERIVSSFLDGLVAANGTLIQRLEGTDVIVRRSSPPQKVGLVSGGGSGHEPAHAGYVGKGMLDAAVAGEVFTSPGADQFFAAIQAADQGEGVLLLIKNYNGDVMNGEMAQEMAEAEGIKTEMVIINDDVAVNDPDQRRGIAGTVLVQKITGALAETGASLQDAKRIAEKTVSRVRSMSVALTPCTLPAVAQPSFDLAEDEMEVGIGIHGERGMDRREVASSEKTAQLLLESVLKEIPSAAPLALLINGMGSTPLMEQHVFANDVIKQLDRDIQHTYVGDYMTSLDMAGVSLTLLAVDDELSSYLQAPVHTVQWTQC